MIDINVLSDYQLVLLYQSGNDTGIAELFKRKFALLFGTSYQLLNDEQASRDCIQNLLEKWLKMPLGERKKMFNEGINGFLAKSISNASIDYLRSTDKSSLREKFYSVFRFGRSSLDNYFYELQEKELQERIALLHEIINTLADREKAFVELWLKYPRNKKKIRQELNLTDSEYRTLQQKVWRTVERKFVKKNK